MTLDQMRAIAKKAAEIEGALRRLQEAEAQLASVNRYAAENKGKEWRVEVEIAKRDPYPSHRPPTITVGISHDFVIRQAIDKVHAARRDVVAAGGELPPATEQVQRWRS